MYEDRVTWMKIWGLWLTAALLLVAAMSVFYTPVASVNAQDGAEETISALETQVAELQTQVASLSTPMDERAAATEAAGEPEPRDSSTPLFVGGEAVDLVPNGEDGVLAVAAVGTYDGNLLPVVVRNNTDGAIVDVALTAVARDGAGDIIATGGDQEFRPSIVPPGDITIGYLYFDGAELPGDTEFEFEADGDPPSDDPIGRRDLIVEESNLVQDRVVGELSNPHEEAVEGPIGIHLACFAEDGTLLSFHQDYADDESVDPGDTAAFQVTLFDTTDCSRFVVAASGYNF